MPNSPNRPALNQLLEDSPFTNLIGFKLQVAGDDILATMPFRETLLGNVMISALHGGAMAAFLELVSTAKVILVSNEIDRPKIVNISINYHRQGRALDLFGAARVVKKGRRIVTVHAEAWQSHREKAVVSTIANFKVGGQQTD